MKGIILSFLLLTSCSAPSTQTPKNEAVSAKPNQLQLSIPNTGWEPIFFKYINERASLANLPSLRSSALPKDDLEVRVWHGFGLTALEGFILRRASGNWTALHLRGIDPRLPQSEYQRKLEAPKSGWDACWRRLEDARISSLPDAAEIRCSVHMFDGMSYVVEVNSQATYRTYLYDNPRFAKCAEAKQMIRIGYIIAEEFNLQEMTAKE